MKCQEISYKLDDETEYKNFVYIDSLVRRGRSSRGKPSKDLSPHKNLYIEIPRNTAVGL